jgi:competence protein ComEA
MKICKKIFTLLIVISVVAALAHVALAEGPAKIDLNRASVKDLTQLKGVGQKYAARIVEYREENGQFNQIEDIMKIKGIGPKKFESIKDFVVVGPKEE